MSGASRDALERLYLDYVHAVDEELERWPELFTPECSYRITSRENASRGLPLAIVRCDSQGMLRDRVDAIRTTAFYVRRTSRHLLGPLDARSCDGGFAVAATFAVYVSLPRAATVLLCVGVYDDVVVDTPGGLRFRQKHCIYDGDLLTESIVHPF